MFKCRACSGTPFAAFFGFSDAVDNEKEDENKDTSDTDDGGSAVKEGEELSNVEPEEMNEPRNSEEVGYLVKTWDTYVHERAKSLWSNSKNRRDVLKSIARGCRREDDPVLGNDHYCVKWIGKYEDGYPVILMSRPGDEEETTTFVNRVLVFLFADQESYEKIDASNRTAFPMFCGDKSCINLTHILLD